MNIKTLFIILALSVWTKGVSQEENYDISKTTLSEFITSEREFVGGKIKDKSVYSIDKNLEIASYIRKDNNIPNLDLIVRYVYSKKDSIIKEIRYELDVANFEKNKEKTQKKDFRKALVKHYLLVEKGLLSKLGKSQVEGKLTEETTISEKTDYCKKNTWIIGNTKINLLLEMSNSIKQKKNEYPNHKIFITYRVFDDKSKSNITEYIAKKN
ncbi:hypothetical protein [Algibacter sp. L1A34]|uniref:hypothetical protein n=1 Tax=Algibacter sp. L1A34 TaxID=2686365 RepID=UPI00131BD5AF|nr:hypothetical protein [Algibacter sp. L1A34]